MPRPNIARLITPLPRYRLSCAADNFETLADVRREDLKRARLLRRDAALTQSAWGERAKALADLLDPQLSPKAPRTIASARYKRRHRRRIVGHLGRLIAREADGRVSNFTVIHRSWTWHFDTLDSADLTKVVREFRNDLNRAKTAISKPEKSAARRPRKAGMVGYGAKSTVSTNLRQIAIRSIFMAWQLVK